MSTFLSKQSSFARGILSINPNLYIYSLCFYIIIKCRAISTRSTALAGLIINPFEQIFRQLCLCASMIICICLSLSLHVCVCVCVYVYLIYRIGKPVSISVFTSLHLIFFCVRRNFQLEKNCLFPNGLFLNSINLIYIRILV